MERFLITAALVSLLLSACLPPGLQPSAATSPPVDLNATAAILVAQTIEAMPSQTPAPSITPVVLMESTTSTPSLTPTTDETQISQTGTSTETSGTITASAQTSLAGITTTSTPTIGVVLNATPSETLHPRFYGTLPPNLPSGTIELLNRSKVEAYISLQVKTKEGYTTILEYPVPWKVTTDAPAGKYTYVAWVGGKKMTGNFSLGQGSDARISIYKDHIEVKSH